MSESIAAQLQPENPHSKESLFPEGWEDQLKAQPPEADETIAESEESPQPGDESADDADALAQAQEEESEAEGEAVEAAQQALDMTVGQFANAAGVTMQDIFGLRMSDGRTLSEMVDDTGKLKEANDALLRERSELQEKVKTASTQMPTGGVAPEAQAMLAQAQIYHQALMQTDWSQVDAATAANQKFDLQQAIGQLQGQAQMKQAEYIQKQQARATEAMAEAERQIRAKIPEWTNEQTMAHEKRGIGDMLRGYGYTQQEIDSEMDPRMWKLIHDAWKNTANVKRINEKAKTIRKVSRTLPPGSRTPTVEKKPNLKDASRTIREARKTGGRRAEIEAIIKTPLG